MKKLLVVCGPTATGKTSLSLKLAEKFKGELISADSRQVYKNMDIGTGKDIPKGATYKVKNKKLGGYYQVNKTKIWGYDLVSPRREFSVAQYVEIAREVIKDIWERDKLPILVGGTGFYIQGVVDGIETASVPKNKKLRKSLEGKSAEDLFEHLAQVAPIKAASLNMSDRKNPRRLIRAIEIAQWGLKGGKKEEDGEVFIGGDKVLFVGLRADRELLCKRVEKRVKSRIEEGIEEEIKKLLKMGVRWKSQSMDSLGYKQWKGYFKGDKKLEEVIKEWEREECNYAKRQMTWFKKDKRINWFDISKENYRRNVEKLVKKWYKQK